MTSTSISLPFFNLKILSQVIILVLILHFPLPNSFVDGYMIRDLQFTSTFFDSQATVWNSSGTFSSDPTEIHPKTRSICSSNPLIISSPDSLQPLKREYDNLPPHQTVYIRMSLWFEGEDWYNSTNNPNTLKILIDTQALDATGTIYPESSLWSVGNCLKEVTLNIKSSHSASKLKLELEISSSEMSELQVWGVRDIQILFSNTTTSQGFCINFPYSLFFAKLISYGEDGAPNTYNYIKKCPCSGPNKNTWSSSCVACDPTCLSCFNGSPTGCLSCAPKHSYDGTRCIKCDDSCETCFGTASNQCLTCPQGIYKYTNGTCKPTCQEFFRPSEVAGYRYCSYPCSYATYLYWNGTCSNCTFPLVPQNTTSFRLCIYPCKSNEYLYWNGTCSLACHFPLQTQTLEAGKSFCLYPCLTTQFLYWNGSCLDSCEYPFASIEEANRRYCRLPCQEGLYLFDNGSCIPEDLCVSPLNRTKIQTVKICNRPCKNQRYYYPEDKTCKTTCVMPYKFNITDLSMSCQLPVTADQKKEVEKMNSLSGQANEATQGVVSISVVASTDPGGSSASMLSKVLQYTRYINITYSAKLELMFKSKNMTSGFIPFLPPIYKDLKDHFAKGQVPAVFSKYNIHSSFLVNFWDGLICLGISFGLWIIFRILELIFTKFTRSSLLHLISFKIRTIIQNFIITQFYSIYGDILMFFAIELKTTELNALSLGLSFFTAMMLVGFGLLIIYVHLKIILQYQNLRVQALRSEERNVNEHGVPEALEDFNKKYEGMKVLFINFKDASFLHQAFFLALNLRNAFFALVIGLLFEYPIVQVSILTGFTVVTVFYLLMKRPFKTVVNFLQQLFAEIILLAVNICLISLAAMDFQGSITAEKRNNASQVIIFCNIVIGFVAPVFGVAKVIVTIYDYIRLKRLKARKAKKDVSLEKGKIGQVFFRGNNSQIDFSQSEHTNFLDNNNTVTNNTSTKDAKFLQPKAQKQKMYGQFPKNSLNIDPFTRALRLKTVREMQKKEIKLTQELYNSEITKNQSDLEPHHVENSLLNTSAQLLEYQTHQETGFSINQTSTLFTNSSNQNIRQLNNFEDHSSDKNLFRGTQ